MLLGHGSIMNVIEKGPNVHIMIWVLPIRDAKTEVDYVTIVLPWVECIEEVLEPKSIENGMRFHADRSISGDEFMISYKDKNSNRIEKNNVVFQAALKEQKKMVSRL